MNHGVLWLWPIEEKISARQGKFILRYCASQSDVCRALSKLKQTCTCGLLYCISARHDYTIGTLNVLHACDASADVGMTYSVMVQCTDGVVFPSAIPPYCCIVVLS